MVEIKVEYNSGTIEYDRFDKVWIAKIGDNSKEYSLLEEAEKYIDNVERRKKQQAKSKLPKIEPIKCLIESFGAWEEGEITSYAGESEYSNNDQIWVNIKGEKSKINIDSVILISELPKIEKIKQLRNEISDIAKSLVRPDISDMKNRWKELQNI